VWRGIKNLPRAFDSLDAHYTPDYWENFAMLIGTAQSRILNGAVSQMVNGMHMRGTVGMLNDKFFQYNFMDTWNRSMHIEATKHAVEFLRDHANNINPKHSERFLRDVGLEAKNVKFVNGQLDISDPKVKRAIIQFVNEAMAHPDAGSNPFWMNDPHWALVAQMKRFTFGHSKYVLERGAREWETKNTWVLAPAILAMPWMLASDAIRDTLIGKDMSYRDNWGVSDYMIQGFERAGHAGKGQFGADIWNDVQRGGTGIQAVMGPAFENFGATLQGASREGTSGAVDGLIGDRPMGRLLGL
jgi:hypothetical protein